MEQPKIVPQAALSLDPDHGIYRDKSQALICWLDKRTRQRERIEMKAISMKATRCPSVRSKMVCVLQTYMGKEFNVNGQIV